MTKPTCPIIERGKPCGQKIVARGWCNKHWNRWRKYGDPEFTKQIRGDIEARFWSHVERRGDDECWPWKSLKNENGYATFTIGGKRVSAHRWAYERFVGPIPEGLTIDHVKANGCTRRDCTNWVSHLEPVTMRENTLRSNSPSAVNARKTHCDSGHELTSDNVYIDGTRRRCRACNRARSLAYFRRKRAEGAA